MIVLAITTRFSASILGGMLLPCPDYFGYYDRSNPRYKECIANKLPLFNKESRYSRTRYSRQAIKEDWDCIRKEEIVKIVNKIGQLLVYSFSHNYYRKNILTHSNIPYLS